MYLAVPIMSIVFALLTYISPKVDKILYGLEVVILTSFLCLRYGQGTDYFQYERMYNLTMTGIDFNWLFNNNVHGEMGYKILEGITKWFGLPFVAFFGIISFFIMYCTVKGINRYSEYRTMSIVLLIPTFYFSYYIGIVREGIGIAIVLGWLIPLYIEKNYFKYCIGVVLVCSIHKYAFVLFLPIIMDRIKLFKSRKIKIVIAVICGSALWHLLCLLNIRAEYILFSPSYLAILLRVILYYVITHLYKRSVCTNEIDDRLYDFYTAGFVLYIATCPMAFISHRVTAYMKIAEVVLIPRLVRKTPVGKNHYSEWNLDILKRNSAMLLMCILCVEGVKNISSYIGQGEYYDFVTVTNFPYVIIFNQDDIFKYRYDDMVVDLDRIIAE